MPHMIELPFALLMHSIWFFTMVCMGIITVGRVSVGVWQRNWQEVSQALVLGLWAGFLFSLVYWFALFIHNH